MLKILFITLICVSFNAYAENATVVKPTAKPLNSYPKPSYYENGMPVYVNDSKENGTTEVTRKTLKKKDSFPHYQGVNN